MSTEYLIGVIVLIKIVILIWGNNDVRKAIDCHKWMCTGFDAKRKQPKQSTKIMSRENRFASLWKWLIDIENKCDWIRLRWSNKLN